MGVQGGPSYHAVHFPLSYCPPSCPLPVLSLPLGVGKGAGGGGGQHGKGVEGSMEGGRV